MDRDDNIATLLELAVMGVLLMGGVVGTYEYTKHKFFASGFQEGRLTERFALHDALVSEIETTYHEGLADGIKQARADCDESGRY